MISPVLTIVEGMQVKNQTKMKIGVRSVVKAKVGELEENTREGRRSSTGKEVAVYVHAMVRKKIFLVQF